MKFIQIFLELSPYFNNILLKSFHHFSDFLWFFKVKVNIPDGFSSDLIDFS